MYAALLQNAGKILGLFAGCFVALILLLSIMEQLGVGPETTGAFLIIVPVAAYAGIAWLARTMRIEAWYASEHQPAAVYRGMANAAGWVSGALLVALTGSLYLDGYAGLALIIGWTGGVLLAGSLIAPCLARSACYTVPEFLLRRYGSTAISLCGVAILTVASFSLLIAQLQVSGIIAMRLFGVSRDFGMWAALVAVLLCALPGGNRALAGTQLAQYVVLVIAILASVIWMSGVQGHGIVPHFFHGDALRRIGELETGYGLSQAAQPIGRLSVLTTPQYKPSGSMQTWRFIALALCMTAGAASLPHMLMRLPSTASPSVTRATASWSLLFILIVVLSLPALTVLTKLQVLDPSLATALVGKRISEIMSMEWVQDWSATGMLAIADQNADGLLQLNELFMRPDMVLLASPEMAGMPHVMSGLVAAGILAAMMAGGGTLLLAIANSLGHDFYRGIIDPKADMAARLFVARGLLVLLGIAAVFLASRSSATIKELVVWAFCLACSALFFPLVLGIWWKRTNGHGAVAGMIAGSIAGGGYLYLLRRGVMEPFFGLDDLRFGIVGMAASLVALVAVTLATPQPDAKIRRIVDDIRSP